MLLQIKHISINLWFLIILNHLTSVNVRRHVISSSSVLFLDPMPHSLYRRDDPTIPSNIAILASTERSFFLQTPFIPPRTFVSSPTLWLMSAPMDPKHAYQKGENTFPQAASFPFFFFFFQVWAFTMDVNRCEMTRSLTTGTLCCLLLSMICTSAF